MLHNDNSMKIISWWLIARRNISQAKAGLWVIRCIAQKSEQWSWNVKGLRDLVSYFLSYNALDNESLNVQLKDLTAIKAELMFITLGLYGP